MAAPAVVARSCCGYVVTQRMTLERNVNTLGPAAVVAASTFVPLPLVDDWIASLSRRQLVRSALRRHGRTYVVNDVKPLYDVGGSLLGLPWRIAKGIIMAPINKVLKKVIVVFAARDVALAIGKTIALGHILERELSLGAFKNEATRDERRDEAERLRKALDVALKDVDFRLLQRAATSIMARARKQPAPTEDVQGFLADIEKRVDQAMAGLR
jgi:hypothetical protein